MGKKNQQTPGGDLELAILEALWDEGSDATARQVHTRVGVPRGIVYTTVAKVLDRMVDKRMVRRRRVGRAFSYRPRYSRAETHRAMARDLIAQISNHAAPRPAVAALVGALEDVSSELLDAFADEIARRRGEDDAS